MRIRLLAVALVLAAALADVAGAHAFAYYALVAAVPLAAVAALLALGAILDGSAAAPLDRVLAALSAVALPILLLGTAVRAPLLTEGPPPTIGVSCIVACLVVFAAQAMLAATAAVPRGLRAALKQR
jgi:hypothetical protein